MIRRRGIQWIVGLTVLALASVAVARHFHIRHFRTVRDDILYRSGQPLGMDWARLNYGYHIRTVVNLRSMQERREGNWCEQEQQETSKYQMDVIDLPMDGDVPDKEQANRFMETVCDPGHWPVLLHCKRGRDRTGTMAALFRMHVQGWSFDRALEELTAVKGEPPKQDVLDFLRSYRPPADLPRPSPRSLRAQG